jgi:hypothetical protein
MKQGSKKGIDKEQIILQLIQMRIVQMATTKTLLDYLMIELKYATTYSYELINESKKRIGEIFKEEHQDSYETAKARLEQMIEKTESEKIRIDAIKELNKLLGIYKPVKVDVTTNGESINKISVIKLIEYKKNEGDDKTEKE